MFEHELEMEKRESSVAPLLLMVALIVAIVGMAGYFVLENRKVLTQKEATSVAGSILQAEEPATLKFHTGLLSSNMNDSPSDPHYRLLEKAGLVRRGKAAAEKTSITLTPKGEEFLKQISGVVITPDTGGTHLYVVPLARRELVGISKITMGSAGRATVDFTWRWVPNPMGDLLDAAGPAVRQFNTWDRATLIQKHGATFYHAEPAKVTLSVMKTDKGWEPAAE
jgi:predicted transcriptional regulator